MENRKHCSHSQKCDNQNIKDLCPVSLLWICGKIFKRVFFKKTFNFFSNNKLISKNPYSFQYSDYCINQLLSINHEMFTSFDKGLDVATDFLYISNVFDKVWQEGLIFKLNQNCISVKRLYIFSDFSSNMKQIVALNGQNSSWAKILAGVLHVSILISLLV